jgi:hypothetical protein
LIAINDEPPRSFKFLIEASTICWVGGCDGGTATFFAFEPDADFLLATFFSTWVCGAATGEADVAIAVSDILLYLFHNVETLFEQILYGTHGNLGTRLYENQGERL